MLLPEVTVSKSKRAPYSSAFDGSLSNFMDVTNALSGGILNRASATQNLRAAYDTYKYLKGDITRSQLGNSIIYGNNGIVSDNYSNEHPIISSLLNFAGDVAGGISTYKSASNLIKPRYNPEAYSGKSFVYRKPTPKLFVTPHSNVKDLTSNIDLLWIAKDNTYGGSRIVDQYGDIDFNILRFYIDKLNNSSISSELLNPKNIYNLRPYVTTSTKNGVIIPTILHRRKNLLQHSFGTARSAIKAPTPKGYTKQEQVEAALLHDVGKLFGDYENHAEKSIDILNEINYPLTKNVRNAIVKHMSPNMLDEDNLTRSVKFSDVSDGIDPDLAFHLFPNLVYPRQTKNPIYYIGNSFRDQAKNINKIFRKLGYDKIDINDTQKNQMNQIADRIDQMRTFLRGISSKGLNYKNIIGQIPKTPTGAGRSNLFHVINNYDDTFSHIHDRRYSERYGINPDTRDGLYVSTDPEIAKHFNGLNAHPSLLLKHPSTKYRNVDPNQITQRLVENIIHPFKTNAEFNNLSNRTDYDIMYQAQTGSGITKAMQDFIIKNGYLNEAIENFRNKYGYEPDVQKMLFQKMNKYDDLEKRLKTVESDVSQLDKLTKIYGLKPHGLRDSGYLLKKNYSKYISELVHVVNNMHSNTAFPKEKKRLIIGRRINEYKRKLLNEKNDLSWEMTDFGKSYFELMKDKYGILRSKIFKEQNLVPSHDIKQFHDNMMYIVDAQRNKTNDQNFIKGYMQGKKGRHVFKYLEDLNDKNKNKISKLKFNKGKNKPGYYQFMENLADKKAQEWTTVPFLPLNPNIVLTQMLNDNTYNYRQWYNNLPFGATVNDFGGHFPDTYKTVYHPTFSNESIYSPNNKQYIPNTQYNPNNITGGTWSGNNYILSKDQIDNNWDVNRTVDYLLKADPGVNVLIPQYNSGKSIHIKKENRGKFTAAANRHGMSVQAFARKVLNAPKGKYSSTLRKRANFAKNASKWHK